MREVIDAWRRSRELPEQAWDEEVIDKALEGFRSLRERRSLLDHETLSAKIAFKEEEILAFMLEDYFIIEFEKALRSKEVERSIKRGQKIINFAAEARRTIKKLVEDIRSGSQIELEEESLFREKSTAPYQLVIALKEVEQFLGVDGKRHGPLKPGDVATLPAQNAEILISGGFVQGVE